MHRSTSAAVPRNAMILGTMTSILVAFIVICVLVLSPFQGNAQVRPVNDYGALGLGRLLKRLNTTASVMMIGAHPDDENSSLLAYLARGENARTAYLSLTRGDGGQNIIGPELFESLGVIRTEELLQARRLDGAEQYFGRAFDYGFSKTLAEARSKWDEKTLTCDVVRAIRQFRPLVFISTFSGTPSDGHGQHQFAGYISPIAIKAAADPSQCTDAGPPWQVRKFYRGGFGQQGGLRINTGQFDLMLGRSYAEIAIEGRSLHRSQGEGRIEPRGDTFSGITLVDSTVPKIVAEKSVFDGLDTSLTGIPKTYLLSGVASDAMTQLSAAQAAAEKALREFDFEDPSKVLPALLNGRDALGRLLQPESKTDPVLAHVASIQRGIFEEAIAKAIGLQVDALADAETVAPGEQVNANIRVYFPKSPSITFKKIEINRPPAWTVTPIEEQPAAGNPQQAQNANGSARFRIDVPRDEQPTQPYWLRSPRDGDLFRWPAESPSLTKPFDPQLVSAVVSLDINGQTVAFTQPLQFRFADPSRGEVRRNVDVVPKVSITVEPELLIVPLSDKPQTKKLTLSITNNSAGAVNGSLAANISSDGDWKTAFSSTTFSLKTRGEKTSIPFEVTIPARTKAGSYDISPNAAIGEALASQKMNVVAYPHVQTHRYYTRAQTMVNVLDLKTVPVRVGYVMGSGDDIPEALKQMGLNVTLLGEDDLASGDLSKFDTIVVGIRAYETRPDLVANNKRLLDWVNGGGTMIVQYQRGNFAQRGFTPYPVDSADRQGTAAGSIARVVDENAPVRILTPQHPVFNFPNKITDADFTGWVQERNAYNMVTFDPKYTPLLESHDAGEQENKGGLIVAQVGKGNYVYCSYSFFRQLPAGVTGAYRLFDNLVSLSKAPGR